MTTSKPQAQTLPEDFEAIFRSEKSNPPGQVRWNDDDLRSEVYAWHLKQLTLQAQAHAEELGKVRKEEAQYYSKRYTFDRDRAFDEFVKMLATALVSETPSPVFMSKIIDATIKEYQKIYHREALKDTEQEKV